MSQALYPDLKTHVIEHHWLQNTAGDGKSCNPRQTMFPNYDGCDPYYFNHGYSSAPASLFYDGHVEIMGQLEAEVANNRNISNVGYGLWSIDTPLGGDWGGGGGGYFGDVVADNDTGNAQRIIHTPYQSNDNAHGNRVETDERLIVDQYLGVHDHCTRQCDTPCHST